MDTIRLRVALAIFAIGLMGCATSAPPDFSTFTNAELRATQQRVVADLERERLRDLPPEHTSLSRVDAVTAELEHGQSEACVAHLLLTLESIDAELSARMERVAETAQ